jgi:chromosome segregation protein
MKITAIRFAGFRGARHEVSLKLPLGFVVVEGRNGSGKSTLCDAIEFALSGTIRGSSGHTEKGEGIRDYTWWRGSPRHGDSFVEITLCDTEGRACTVRRTPNGVSVQPDLGLEEVLCSSSTALESPLLQLCRTTILRDEEITQLSVDLRESERFEFVRAALGTADLSTIERKTKDALELVGAEVLREERVYSDARDRVADILTRLSRARVEAARTANVPSAEALLRDSLGLPDCTADELADRSEARLSELRARTDQLTRLCARLQLFEQRKAALDAEKQQSAIRLLAEAAAAAADRVSAFEKEAAAATEALAAAQTESPQNASLALLREHGERVGLLGGRCPLCGTAQPEETFRAHLHILADKITRSNGILTSLTKSSAEASAQLLAMRAELSKRSAQLTAAREQMFAMSAEWEALLHDARADDPH